MTSEAGRALAFFPGGAGDRSVPMEIWRSIGAGPQVTVVSGQTAAVHSFSAGGTNHKPLFRVVPSVSMSRGFCDRTVCLA